MTAKQLYNKEWYIRNKKLTIDRAYQWAKDNPNSRKTIRNKWRNNNLKLARSIEAASSKKRRKAISEYQRQYRIDNPGLSASYCAKRRAALLQRTPKWLTESHYNEIAEFYIIAKELQWLSETPLHIDHIVPLRGKHVSGLHVPWNLQILPRSDNCHKSNKYE